MDLRSRTTSRACRLAVALTALSIMATTAPATAAVTIPPPGTACDVLPANNVWNTDVSALAVDPHSKSWLATMHAGSTNLHPDFGGPYGLPYAVVDSSHPKVSITFHYRQESDPGPYPFGKDIPLEGGSDRHALMIDKDTCVLYELFAARWHHGDPTAGSGAIFDLGANDLRPDGWTSADAAGLAIFPSLLRRDEVNAGFIGHAIRFTTQLTDCRHLWPARHDAGTCDKAYPPMGARFRMRGSFDISHYSADARVILQAMKTYGLFLADNGSDWYFQGAEDRHWKNTLLDELKSVPASAFEAVDESACIVDPNSAEADCP
jgi:hypothetical protein